MCDYFIFSATVIQHDIPYSAEHNALFIVGYTHTHMHAYTLMQEDKSHAYKNISIYAKKTYTCIDLNATIGLF